MMIKLAQLQLKFIACLLTILFPEYLKEASGVL